jgi:hypothetical protein
LLPTVAVADEPERERRLVYGITADAISHHAHTFSPPQYDTVYLIADRTSVLSPAETMVYYWPISMEYVADWATLNQPVRGALEVVDAAGNASQLALQEYALEFVGDPASLGGDMRGSLHLGAAARERREEFERAWSAYPELVEHYKSAMAQYSERLRDGTATPEEEPDAPQPPDFLVSPVQAGYVMNLAEGHYRIRVRDDEGRVMPDSDRSLVVFAPRRLGVGYEIIPESKWTRPEASYEPADRLYAPHGTTLYLQPYYAEEVNELFYRRLLNPQSRIGGPDRWTWVQAAPIESAQLGLVWDDRATTEIERKGYYVRQVPGAGLGYEVIEWTEEELPGRTPTFSGYRVSFEGHQALRSLILFDATHGAFAGSARRVVSTGEIRDLVLFLPVFVPLVTALCIAMEYRRRRAVFVDEKEPGVAHALYPQPKP